MIDLSYRKCKRAEERTAWQPEEVIVGIAAVIGWIWIALLIAGAL